MWTKSPPECKKSRRALPYLQALSAVAASPFQENHTSEGGTPVCLKFDCFLRTYFPPISSNICAFVHQISIYLMIKTFLNLSRL